MGWVGGGVCVGGMGGDVGGCRVHDVGGWWGVGGWRVHGVDEGVGGVFVRGGMVVVLGWVGFRVVGGSFYIRHIHSVTLSLYTYPPTHKKL